MSAKKPKVVYLAHPIGGDIARNLQCIYELIRTIAFQYKNVVPFAPYIAYVHALNDYDALERKTGLSWSLHFVHPDYIDELWICKEVSPGMQLEIDRAKSFKIPIKDFR